MTGTTKRLAVLTSGGDAPGMNAAIRATTMVAIAEGWEVFGVQHGYRGLVDGDLISLTPDDVLPILRYGGTMLGSARCKEFHEVEVRDQARAALASHGIEALVVIGGNGSLTGALALSDPSEMDSAHPIRVAGIPASIDNDLALTSLSIGVDTATNTIVEAIDKIADTASAHDRTFLVEVMGRDSGYLALAAAAASGADMVMFPEEQRSTESLVAAIVSVVRRVRASNRQSKRVIAVKSEGISVPVEELKVLVDAQLGAGGIDNEEIETRVTVLGHVVRGGRPSAQDRLIASRLGRVATSAVIEGQTRFMAAWLPTDPPVEPLSSRSKTDPHCYLIDLATVLEATDAQLRGDSPYIAWRSGLAREIERLYSAPPAADD